MSDAPTNGTPSDNLNNGHYPMVTSHGGPGRHRHSGHRPSDSKQAISAGFVLFAAHRWWKVALPVGLLLAAITGALVYYSFEPMYRASAWLQIAGNRPRVVL